MWATTLRPKAMQNELIFVNRQKVLVFGIWQQLESGQNSDNYNDEKILCNQDKTSDKKQEKKENEQKFDIKEKKEKMELTKNVVNKYRLQTDQNSQEIENSNYSTEIKNLIKEMVSTNQDYLHDLADWQTEKMKNIELINDWQQKVSLFCTSNQEEQKAQIENLEKLLIKISNIKNIQNWQKNNQEWLMCAKKSVEENWFNPQNKAKFEKELEDFRLKTNQVLKPEFDNTNFGQKLLQRIESVENWERERLRNLPKFNHSPKVESTLIFFGNKEI